MNDQLSSVSLDDWKIYLRWRTLDNYAPPLSKAFVDEDFQFNGAYMSGQKEIEPRWKRCVQSTDQKLGMAWASSTSTKRSARKARNGR